VHIIDDPALLLARLAASDDMYKRFGLPPGQSGAYHKAVRDLYAPSPLADLDLSFVVLDPLSGAATRLIAAVDNDGNPMYMREAALKKKLRPADLPVPGQAAAPRAKQLADPLEKLDLAPRLLSELSELPQRLPASAPGRPRAALSHQSTKLASIQLKGLPLTTALGFDQEHGQAYQCARPPPKTSARFQPYRRRRFKPPLPSPYATSDPKQSWTLPC
jgi:hypothetical protein